MSVRFRFGPWKLGYALIVVISQETDNRQVESGNPNKCCRKACLMIGIPNIIRGRAHCVIAIYFLYPLSNVLHPLLLSPPQSLGVSLTKAFAQYVRYASQKFITLCWTPGQHSALSELVIFGKILRSAT